MESNELTIEQKQKQKDLALAEARALVERKPSVPLGSVLPSIKWVRAGSGIFNTVLGGYLRGNLVVEILRKERAVYVVRTLGKVYFEDSELRAKMKAREALQKAFDERRHPAEELKPIGDGN